VCGNKKKKKKKKKKKEREANPQVRSGSTSRNNPVTHAQAGMVGGVSAEPENINA
jgi:hypothetical protein